MIEIIRNGSKSFGQEPDGIDVLLTMLVIHTLEPSFETSGNFITEYGGDWNHEVRFFGNFYDYSHAFDLITDETDVIDKLTLAIRANQETVAYKEARDKIFLNPLDKPPSLWYPMFIK